MQLLCPLILLVLIANAESSFGKPPRLENDPLEGIECYQCTEIPENDNRMSCHVQSSLENLLVIQSDVSDDDDEDRDLWDWDNELEFYGRNPCKVVTEKVLNLVEIGEQQQTLLPIFVDVANKDMPEKYETLRSAISTIQFEKRENSAWIAVEVQLRDTDDMFSFVLPDFDLDLMGIPHGYIFYTSL